MVIEEVLTQRLGRCCKNSFSICRMVVVVIVVIVVVVIVVIVVVIVWVKT